jgi:hypothetical protein
MMGLCKWHQIYYWKKRERTESGNKSKLGQRGAINDGLRALFSKISKMASSMIAANLQYTLVHKIINRKKRELPTPDT